MDDAVVLEDLVMRYADPEGFTAHVRTGWNGIEPDEDSWPERLGPARMEFGGRSYPASFELWVQRDAEPGPFVRLALLLDTGRHVHLMGIGSLIRGVDADVALAQLLAVRHPIDWWKTRALLELTVHDAARRLPDSPTVPPDVWNPLLEELQDVARIPQRRRRDRLTPQRLEQVANVYRAAWRAGGNPTRAVAEHFSKPYSTASRWVVAARKSGALGPADGSRGGERRPEGETDE